MNRKLKDIVKDGEYELSVERLAKTIFKIFYPHSEYRSWDDMPKMNFTKFSCMRDAEELIAKAKTWIVKKG